MYKLCLCVSVVIFAGLLAAPPARCETPPRVFLIDPRALAETRQRIRSGDKTFDVPLGRLEEDARKASGAGPFSVTTKAVTPPSGDRHDYMSQAPYFWPDPKRPDGLPYVRRDGERNPEINKITDHREMDRMVDAVSALALAYYLKGDEAHAAKAAALLRAWFISASGLPRCSSHSCAAPPRGTATSSSSRSCRRFPPPHPRAAAARGSSS